MLQNKPTFILFLLISLTLVRGLIYASLMPPWWMGHDEDFHFGQARHLIDQLADKSPSQSQDWLQEMVATFAAFPLSRWYWEPDQAVNLTVIPDRYAGLVRPSLSYYLYAWPGQLLTQQALLTQFFVFRLVSVLLTAGTILLAGLSARQVFADSPMAQILTPWLILFNPSFMVIGSSISDGNLATLLAGAIFYLLLLETVHQRTGWRLLVALGLTILALWTKATTYFLLPVWGALLAIYAWRAGQKYRLWSGVAAGLLIISVLFLLPEQFRTYLTYFSQPKMPWTEGLAYAFSFEHLWKLFASFWMVLGHEVYRLAPSWYFILLLFSLLAVVGLLLYRRSDHRNLAVSRSLLLALLFAGSSLGVLFGIAILRGDQLRLARYIFPASIPLSILMVAGWRSLLPPRRQSLGLGLAAVFFFLFDAMVWLDYAIPWYYPFWP
ncbi:MAG: hypothetical protein AB1801_18610 [Chloroflexota bacterium]